MDSQISMMVSGASGALGFLVLGELYQGRHRVIAGTRAAKGVELDQDHIRHIDFDEPQSLIDGFVGVDRLLLISTDELAEPGRRQRQQQTAIDAAVDAGVSYLAYTSMPNPTSSPAIPFASDHSATEAALLASGVPHAVLRNAWYQENLLAYLPSIIAAGTWFTSAADGKIPYVARRDAARSAAALLSSGECGVFDIAGPDALSVEDIAAVVGVKLGRPLKIEHVSADQLIPTLERQGVPAAVATMVAATEANQRDGRFDVGHGDVARLIGRAPTSISQFVEAHSDGLLASQ